MARWPTATDWGLKVAPLWRELQCGRNLVVGFVLLRRERESGKETGSGGLERDDNLGRLWYPAGIREDPRRVWGEGLRC